MYFSFGAFGSGDAACFSITGFFFGGIKRGAGFLIAGGGAAGFGGGGSSTTDSGCWNGMRSFAGVWISETVCGSGKMSIFGTGGGGSSICCSIGGGGARNGSGIGGADDGTTESSDASELIIVTVNRLPIFPSTAVPKTICV